MQITLRRPDDWHLHLRDAQALACVVPYTAAQFARAIIMPNLNPPVTTTAMAIAYRERILACLPEQASFNPLMTLYLTDNTSPGDIQAASDNQHVHAIKLYPAGATTNSEAGVSDLRRTWPALEQMSRLGLPLLVHGEVTDEKVDIFDREAVFIDEVLTPLRRDFPALKVVFEHITTRAAAQFVHDADGDIAATITPQHLLLNRNALFAGGLRPHHYCLPVLKLEQDRQALVGAATSGDARFFLGTDSAPHARDAKEAACGCAGMFTAHAALELYTEVFEQAGALDRLEDFASTFGPRFYGLAPNTEQVILEKQEWSAPQWLPYANGQQLVPFRAGASITWRLQGQQL